MFLDVAAQLWDRCLVVRETKVAEGDAESGFGFVSAARAEALQVFLHLLDCFGVIFFKGERHACPVVTVFLHITPGIALHGLSKGIHGLEIEVLLQQADALHE